MLDLRLPFLVPTPVITHLGHTMSIADLTGTVGTQVDKSLLEPDLDVLRICQIGAAANHPQDILIPTS